MMILREKKWMIREQKQKRNFFFVIVFKYAQCMLITCSKNQFKIDVQVIP